MNRERVTQKELGAGDLIAVGDLLFVVRVDGSPAQIDPQKVLEQGAAAVVDDPGSPDCAVVPADAAKRVYEVDPQAIRFWYGPEKPIGFSDAGE